MDPYDPFLTQLLRDKHGETLASSTADSMKAELLPRLEKFITVKTMEALAQKSTEDTKTFLNMVEAKKPMEEVQSFVDSKIPDYPSVVAKILLQFRNLYLGAAAS